MSFIWFHEESNHWINLDVETWVSSFISWIKFMSVSANSDNYLCHECLAKISKVHDFGLCTWKLIKIITTTNLGSSHSNKLPKRSQLWIKKGNTLIFLISHFGKSQNHIRTQWIPRPSKPLIKSLDVTFKSHASCMMQLKQTANLMLYFMLKCLFYYSSLKQFRFFGLFFGKRPWTDLNRLNFNWKLFARDEWIFNVMWKVAIIRFLDVEMCFFTGTVAILKLEWQCNFFSFNGRANYGYCGFVTTIYLLRNKNFQFNVSCIAICLWKTNKLHILIKRLLIPHNNNYNKLKYTQ